MTQLFEYEYKFPDPCFLDLFFELYARLGRISTSLVAISAPIISEIAYQLLSIPTLFFSRISSYVDFKF